MFDERLNAQRDKNFPNLPAENRSRYYTRIEDETEAPEMIDESETNEPEPNRPNSKGNHGDNSNESNNQEPKNNGDGENEKTGEYNK
jgi:hypothetical protein